MSKVSKSKSVNQFTFQVLCSIYTIFSESSISFLANCWRIWCRWTSSTISLFVATESIALLRLCNHFIRMGDHSRTLSKTKVCHTLSFRFKRILNFYCSFSMTMKAIRIKVGIINLKSNGTVYYIKKAIRHERYYEPYLANDIALLRLQTPIQFNEKVQPIKYTSEKVPVNAPLQVFGFGRLMASILKYSFSNCIYIQ